MSPEITYLDELNIEIRPGQTLLLDLRGRLREAVSAPPTTDIKATGLVIDRDTNAPLSGVRVDLHLTRLYLTRKVKAFEQPSTSSTLIKELEVGDYPVLEIRPNVPTAETDFVKIKLSPTEGTTGWVCSRWKDDHYALLFDRRSQECVMTTGADGKFDLIINESQVTRLKFVLKDYFDGESDRFVPPMNELAIKMQPAKETVSESVLTGLLPYFEGFSYSLTSANYPYELPFLKKLLAPPKPKQNNCCTFVESIALKAWLDAFGATFRQKWTLDLHYKMMNAADSSDNFAPVTGVIEAGMAIEVKEGLPPPWTVVQGSRSGKDGHTFFVIDVHAETKRVLTLESNLKSAGLDGPGFGRLGHLDNFKIERDGNPSYHPGETWWKNENLRTWEAIKKLYPGGVKMARLKVNDLKWVR